MSQSAELLSKATNYAVVQLPGRKFPGVVVQGDSLHTIVQRLARLQAFAKAHDDEELTDGLDELHELLQEVSKHYEQVCKEHGITLPYQST